MPRALGRLTPPDFEHVAAKPVTALETTPTGSVVFGIAWYEGFDVPVLGTDGRYRIKVQGNVRGGHCIASEPSDPGQKDLPVWHVFYNQGEEGACEGFGHSRALSLHTRHQFDAFWLYDDARRIEGAYPNGEGSTNRSACAALERWGDHYEDGHTNCTRTHWRRGVPGVEIASHHWATTAEQVWAILGYAATVGEIPLLNSWGTEYPQRVYIAENDVQTLLDQEGEASILVFK